jgi:hypothetical protein
VLGLERLRGFRLVGDPSAVDAARWDADPADLTVLRFAPDDAFGLGARGVEVDDGHAIVEEEIGFVGAWLSPDALEHLVLPRIEWPLPAGRPLLAQGLVAGVPAKLWLAEDGRALLLAAAPYAEELRARLR